MKRKATCNVPKRKRQAGFTRTDEEWGLITQAARKVGLKPASYMRTVVVRQARADLAA